MRFDQRREAPPAERPPEIITELEGKMDGVRRNFAQLIALEHECSLQCMPQRMDLIDKLVEIDAKRRELNEQLAELDALRPDSEYPIPPLYVGEHLDELVTTVKHRVSWLEEHYPKILERPPSEWDNHKTRDAFSAYLGQYARSFEKMKERANKIARSVERWKEVYTIHTKLGIDAMTERQAEQMDDEEPAVTLGRERSFKNVRKSVSNFLRQRQRMDNISAEDVLREIQNEMKRQEPLVLGYYETLDDVERILDSGSIKNLFELDEQEQEGRKKSQKSLEQIRRERKQIETQLGWPEGQPVYHLVAESFADETIEQPTSENYGAIRFVFDGDQLAQHTTFTEGDSLNPNGVPNGLLDGKGRSVESRQIAREHVAIEKAMFALARPEMTRFERVLSYVEAQVGGVSGEQLFDNLQEVTVDKSAWESEAEYSRKTDAASVLKKLEAFCEQRGIALRWI